jgi:hypothetical protein
MMYAGFIDCGACCRFPLSARCSGARHFLIFRELDCDVTDHVAPSDAYALRSTAPRGRTARRTSGQRRWRHPTPYRRGLPNTPSQRDLILQDRDLCANPDPRSSVAYWRRLGSGSHRRQNLRPQPDQPRGMLRRHARTRGEKYLPLGSARCGRARTLNGPGWHLRCRACRTSDRRGSPKLHGKSAAPNGSQRHTPQPASVSSVPDQSTGRPMDE